MPKQVDLKVDFCSYQAAKFAVEHWHYSKVMPAGKTVKVGVWENGAFIGAVIYSLGANKNLSSPYGLKSNEACELTRVALTSHQVPVSQVLSITLRLLKQQCPNLRLVVSYADSKEGHHGGIYQATNWVFEGSKIDNFQLVNGSLVHRRTIYSRYGRQDLGWLRENVDPNAEWVKMPPKHKYLYPLDRAMRRQIEPLAQPYPKRANVVQNGNTAGDQSVDDGSIPSVRLTPQRIG